MKTSKQKKKRIKPSLLSQTMNTKISKKSAKQVTYM